MKKIIIKLLLAIAFGFSAYYAYNSGLMIRSTINADQAKLFVEFAQYVLIAGVTCTALYYEFMISRTSKSLEMYKRELEKESIGSTESSSKIKVLESKIQVLEKALDEALKK